MTFFFDLTLNSHEQWAQKGDMVRNRIPYCIPGIHQTCTVSSHQIFDAQSYGMSVRTDRPFVPVCLLRRSQSYSINIQ